MTQRKKARRRDAGRPRGAPVARAVLQSTLDELAESGLEGLSVERVAKRAEVNKTTVYRRWPTREALVAAALEGVRDELSAGLADTGSLRGDLLALVEHVSEFMERPAGRALLRAAVAGSALIAEPGPPSHAPAPGAELPGALGRASARGEWSPRARPDLLLALLVGAIIHRSALERAPLDRPWFEGIVDTVLQGVLPREPDRRPAKAPPPRR